MRNPVRWVVRGFMMVALMIAVLALFGLVVMLLWNRLVPTLFHGPLLAYWQAVGLLILSRLLFGGLRRGGWHGGWRGRILRERSEQMTPEERARLRERVLSRCGHGVRTEAPAPPNAAQP